jgi:hypothetical protein
MQEHQSVWFGHYILPKENSHIVFDLGLGETAGTYMLRQFFSTQHPWLGWPAQMVRRWRYARYAEWLEQRCD